MLTQNEIKAIRIWATAHLPPAERRALMSDIAKNPEKKHDCLHAVGAQATTRAGVIIHVRQKQQPKSIVQTDEQELARLYDLAERTHAAARRVKHNVYHLANAAAVVACATIYGTAAARELYSPRKIRNAETIMGDPIERLAPAYTGRTRDLQIMRIKKCDYGTGSTPLNSATTSNGQTWNSSQK